MNNNNEQNSNENNNLTSWTDNEIKESVTRNLKNTTAEEMKKIVKEIKSKFSMIIASSILISTILLSYGIFTLCQPQSEDDLFIASLTITIGAVLVIIAIVLLTKICKKDTYKLVFDYKVSEIKKLQRDLITAEKRIYNMSHIEGKEVKSAKILDSYTEYSSKLHAILNYEEIRQTRIYKFLATFTDGSTTIYTEKEGSKIYNILINFVNNESKVPTVAIAQNENCPADEIKKYKELFDNGIITQEEFDEKKKELLKK